MQLDKGAVYEAELPFRLSCPLSKHMGPEAGIHPTSPTAIDRVPTSPMRGKCMPSTTLPQDMKDRPEDIVKVKWRSTSFLFFPRFL
jgi:hypothetical protein